MLNQDSSWQNVSGWYDQLVGQTGHHFHSQVIFPYLKTHWSVVAGESVLDLACGQGVLAKFLGSAVSYIGVDIARNLIEAAQKSDQNLLHKYITADVTQNLEVRLKTAKAQLKIDKFDHAACILALQNLAHPSECLKNIGHQLKSGGTAILVLNHPCFRIPRQSGWDTNPATKLVYRWINRYLSFLEIPIKAHPGQRNSPVTWSYHFALQDLFSWLREAGLVVTDLAELVSDKESLGKAAKAENRSRAEIPLFMVIQAKKL